MRTPLAIALLIMVPLVWAANLHYEWDDGIHHHTVLLCNGMACYQYSFMHGTCHFPGRGGLLQGDNAR